MTTEVTYRRVDYTNPDERQAVVQMVEAYARDPLVGGVGLPDEVKSQLGDRLAEHATTVSWLAWDGDEPVGIVNAFLGFSTFAARPLLNLHDVAVIASHRRRGIARGLLAEAEAYARDQGCCSITLEVRGDNTAAQKVYRGIGFKGAGSLDPAEGFAFWKKPLG